MKSIVFAAVAMVAVSLGLAAAQPANAAQGYGQRQETGTYAPGGTAAGTYLGGN